MLFYAIGCTEDLFIKQSPMPCREQVSNFFEIAFHSNAKHSKKFFSSMIGFCAAVERSRPFPTRFVRTFSVVFCLDFGVYRKPNEVCAKISHAADALFEMTRGERWVHKYVVQ